MATLRSPWHGLHGEVAIAAPGRQAYRILHVGYAALPLVAGFDKFSRLLTNWDAYLAPGIAQATHVSAYYFMRAAGVVEIAAGVLVGLKPRVGAYVVALWLAAIIGNLILLGRFYDVALRDFGLMLGALALGRLARAYAD